MQKLINNGPIPLYYQVRQIVRDKILSGEWKYGEEIPSELKLCEEFNLCRGTIQQALEGLVAEGLIVRQQGRGTYVTYRKIKRDFFLEPGFSNKSGRDILNSYSKIMFLKSEIPKTIVKNKLGLCQNEEVFILGRKHYINNIAVAIDYNYVISEYGKELEKQDLYDLAMYKYIESVSGNAIDTYKTSISAIPLDDFEKSELNFPPGDVGLKFCCTVEINSNPVMYNERIYRGDDSTISFELFSFNSHQKYEMKNLVLEINE